MRNFGCGCTSPLLLPLHSEQKKVKPQNKSVLYKGSKEHGLDIYMQNFSKFQNTVMIAHKQLTTVSTSAVTAVAALPSHGFGGTLLPPRGHSTGRKEQKARNSDKSLTEVSCNRRQQGAGRDQREMGLTTFLGRITYKSKQNPSTLKSSYASEKLLHLFGKTKCITGRRKGEPAQRHVAVPSLLSRLVLATSDRDTKAAYTLHVTEGVRGIVL